MANAAMPEGIRNQKKPRDKETRSITDRGLAKIFSQLLTYFPLQVMSLQANSFCSSATTL